MDGKVHEWLHQAGHQDTDGSRGTADVVLDLGLDASSLSPDEANEWARHSEQRSRLQCRIALPPELYPGSATSAAPAAASSAAARSDCSVLRPRLVQGHEIVQAAVRVSDGVPPVLFCTGCGASVQKNVRLDSGLAAILSHRPHGSGRSSLRRWKSERSGQGN